MGRAWLSALGMGLWLACLTPGCGSDTKKPKPDIYALADAINRNDAAALRVLIERGADISEKCLDGSTVLHGSAFLGHTDCVRVLVEHGADVNLAEGHGRTPLHLATCYGQEQAGIVEILLKAKARCDVRDKEGKTPLDYAIENGHAKSEAMLRQAMRP